MNDADVNLPRNEDKSENPRVPPTFDREKFELVKIARLKRIESELGVSLEGIPTRYQNLHAKAILGESSLREAIKAKCYDCSAWDNVSENVGNCTVRRCPLWAYRPGGKG